jgi:ABC-type sugar transport system substrate-binding protein
VVTVTIESYPILTAEVEGLEKAFEKCSECSLGVLPVTVENVGEGSVPSKVAAYLQTHPEVNYVQFTFSDLATGIYDALKPLGLTEKVKMIGQNGNPTNFKEIVEGKASIWTAQPQEYIGWIGMDVLARLATNTPLEPYEKEGKIPYWVVEKGGAEELLEKSEGAWPGPKGFQEKFEELWTGH